LLAEQKVFDVGIVAEGCPADCDAVCTIFFGDSVIHCFGSLRSGSRGGLCCCFFAWSSAIRGGHRI
jgi:hypothetical protein